MASVRVLLGAVMGVAMAGLSGCGGSTAAGPVGADSGMFTQDYAGAVAQAKSEHKMLLLDFTGSDWCVPCQELEHTVFTSPEFAAFAKDKVGVMLDFPQHKELPDALKKQNAELQDKYKIKGFPTVIVVDPATDTELGRNEGYLESGGPAKWVDELKAAMAKGK